MGSPGSRVFGFSTHAQGLRLRRVHLRTCHFSRAKRCCLPLVRTRSATEKRDFGAQTGAAFPPGTGRSAPTLFTAVAPPPEAEVDGLLRFFGKKLSFQFQNRVLSRHTDPGAPRSSISCSSGRNLWVKMCQKEIVRTRKIASGWWPKGGNWSSPVFSPSRI